MFPPGTQGGGTSDRPPTVLTVHRLVGDEDVHGPVVVEEGDVLDHLERESEAHRGGRTPDGGEQPVVVASALAETSPVTVEGHAGDDHDVHVRGWQGRTVGLEDAPEAGGEGTVRVDEFEVTVSVHPGEDDPGAAGLEFRSGGSRVDLAGQRGVERDRAGASQLGEAEEVTDGELGAAVAVAALQGSPTGPQRLAQLLLVAHPRPSSRRHRMVGRVRTHHGRHRVSLRVRLTVYFSIIVVLPLAVAVITARVVLVQELEQRAADELGLGLQAITQQAELIAGRAGDLGEDLASPERGLGTALAGGDRSSLQAALDGVVGDRSRADVVVIADPSGRLLASHVTDPRSPAAADYPTAEQLATGAADGQASPYVLGEVRTVEDARGQDLGAVMAGRWIDSQLAEELAGSLPVEVSLFVEDRPVAATGPQVTGQEAGPAPREQVQAQMSSSLVRAVELDGWTVVASRSRAAIDEARGIITLSSIGVLLAAGLAAALLGWLLSQLVVRPVRELAVAARDVADGDLDRRFDTEGSDELAALGAAFNAMTDNLRTQVRELEVSRDALQHSLDRLGDTLSSTLDLNRTLTAVVDAASSALTAERAALYMLAPGRGWLYVKVGRGLAPDVVDARMELGDGLVGWVAQTGSSVRLPQDADHVPAPAPHEAEGHASVAVPLFSPDRGQVIGVLELLDRADGEPFDEADLHTIRSFAVQAAVAIENVRLHEATQQASVTDGLTGLWNLRYFQQRAEEEVERAERFGHALSLAIMDIDRFKSVNDEHGHLVGDQVLVEVARRVSGEVREVDTVARYGGEEIVIVLPETDLNGARLTAERIRAAVGADGIETDAGPVGVTVSLGVSGYPMHGRTASELLRSADQAMYAAKQGGRDRVEAAPRPDHEATASH